MGRKVTNKRDNSYPTFSLFSVVLGIQILTVSTVSCPTLPHNHRNVNKRCHFLDYNGCSGIGRFFCPSRKAKITNYFNFQLSVADWFISEKPPIAGAFKSLYCDPRNCRKLYQLGAACLVGYLSPQNYPRSWNKCPLFNVLVDNTRAYFSSYLVFYEPRRGKEKSDR